MIQPSFLSDGLRKQMVNSWGPSYQRDERV